MLQSLKEIKNYLERITNSKLYINFLPTGIDLFYDLHNTSPNIEIKVIFDVGANIGQSAQEYIKKSPKSRIYSFEPVKSTFNILVQNLSMYRNVECINQALGNINDSCFISTAGDSVAFSIKDGANLQESELIKVRKLDDFCKERSITKIDFLKIDTEGYDLEVLKGAEGMLNEHLIQIIQVEAGMNPFNSVHVTFEHLKHYLESQGYYLFKIYDQIEDWTTNGRAILRRTNPVFISEKTLLQYKKDR